MRWIPPASSFRSLSVGRSRPKAPIRVACPHCGTENPEESLVCERCGKGLAIYIGPPRRLSSLSLGTIMLLIAITSLALAAFREHPVFGIGLFALLIPAALRTLLHAGRERAWGTPLPAVEAAGMFVGSILALLMIYFLVILVWGIGFGIVGGAIGSGSAGWILSGILTGIPSLALGVWLCRALLTLPKD